MSGRFRAVRMVLVLPLIAIGVVVMHGLGDAGGAHSHSAAGSSVSHDGPSSGTDHPLTHAALTGVCAFAVIVAADRVGRTAPPLRSAVATAQSPTGRLATGPEPPVPRFVV